MKTHAAAICFAAVFAAGCAPERECLAPSWAVSRDGDAWLDEHGNRCTRTEANRYACVTPSGHRWTLEEVPGELTPHKAVLWAATRLRGRPRPPCGPLG